MDEKGFLKFLHQNGRSERTMLGYLDCVKRFEAYLAGYRRRLNQAMPEDIRAFAEWSAKNGQGVAYLAIADYYDWTDNDPLRWTAHELFAWDNFCAYKLSEMLGIDPAHVQILKGIGILTARDLLAAGDTPARRAALSAETGIPLHCIVELVRLSDLARVGGLKKIRGRLYYDAGFDTLDKIAAVSPETLRQQLAEYIQRSGFAGIPPTPKEAANAVAMAHHLKRLVEE